MIIAVAFDGTCVTDEFPKVGRDIGAAEALRTLSKNGHKIVLSTKRWNRTLDDAIKWFKRNGIKLYGMHYMPDVRSTVYRNLYDDLYIGIHPEVIIDSTALGCPLIHGDHAKPYTDWGKAMQLFELIDHVHGQN